MRLSFYGNTFLKEFVFIKLSLEWFCIYQIDHNYTDKQGTAPLLANAKLGTSNVQMKC